MFTMNKPRTSRPETVTFSVSNPDEIKWVAGCNFVSKNGKIEFADFSDSVVPAFKVICVCTETGDRKFFRTDDDLGYAAIRHGFLEISEEAAIAAVSSFRGLSRVTPPQYRLKDGDVVFV